MYSLGCLVYAVHCKGSAPFKNHGSLGGLRDNSSKPLPGMERLDTDLQGSCFSPLSLQAFTYCYCAILRSASLVNHPTSRFPTHTRNPPITFLLFLSPHFHLELSGSLQLHCENARRKNFVYERTNRRSGQIF